jgi:hypothetical protein
MFLLFNFNSALLRDPTSLHQHVIVDLIRPSGPTSDFPDRPAQCDGELFIASIKRLVT